MKYGFIIDNRKCIGCHACTVACKSEHDVPVGVNRTWVKQVEKGSFPNSRRLFSVMRCNHCTDAPCVEICPVEALHIREDGIVDFDNSRCIGCKACTQACPYDALYIDPNTHTAAKCNYCAHRVDVGLEPACVNVCPEHAIISGDMEDPTSEIAQLLASESVSVRKPEKGTRPNLFYIDGDEGSLTPLVAPKTENNLWGSQTGGVGHFAKYAGERMGEKDLVQMAKELGGEEAGGQAPKKRIEVIMEQARRVYDAPHKGTLWGWEVSAYVWTKAISAGTFLVAFLALVANWGPISEAHTWLALAVALVFLGLTGALLVKDLDKPMRFAYVLLRPQWRSWLVRGGYAITVFGGLLTLWGVAKWLNVPLLEQVALWGGAVFALLTAVYTAFLFAQAKGRDFWQSPVLAFHMLGHSIMAGAAVFALATLFMEASESWMHYLRNVLYISIGANLLMMLVELTTTHPTIDAKTTVKMIVSGRYSKYFWLGAILLGNLIPLALATLSGSLPLALAGLCVLLGIYFTEHVWVQAPQQIPLS